MKNTVSLTVLLLLFASNLLYCKVAFTVEKACFGEKTILSSTSSSKDSIIYYNWDLNGNNKFVDASGVVINHKFAAVGTYNVGLQIITDVGDTFSLHKQVVISPLPQADFTVSDKCSLDSTQFTSTTTISSGKVVNYIWHFDDGYGASLVSNPKHKYGADGNYAVKLLAVSDFGCIDSIQRKVDIYPTPPIHFTYDPDTIFFESESTVIGIKETYPEMSWSTGEKTQSVTISTSQLLSINVVSSDGCPNSARIQITAKPRLDLVSLDLITPNNDGHNDVWELGNTGGWKQIRVQVFNRYGDLVFSSEHYNNDWDATFNGNILPEGTYYYIIKIEDNGKVYTGSLSILR